MQEAQQEVQNRRISFADQVLTVQVLNPSSEQQWTFDPAMIEVYLDLATLSRLARTLRIVQREGLAEARVDIGMNYEVFDLLENASEATESPKYKPEYGPDGKPYIVFEPGYRLCEAVLTVNRSGEVDVKVQHKDSRDYLYADLGPIEGLLVSQVVVNDADTFVEQVANMSIWSYDKDDGTPYEECEEPDDGFMDSHEALMTLIEKARAIRA